MVLKKKNNDTLEILMSMRLNIPSDSLEIFNKTEFENMLREFNIIDDCHIGLIIKG